MIIFADLGIPLLMIQWPVMLLVLAPVVFIEMRCFEHHARLERKEALRGSFIANAVSTIIGIPLAWILVMACQVGASGFVVQDVRRSNLLQVLAGPAWIDPYQAWMTPLAMALMLAPSLLLTVWIEYRVCRWTWKTTDPVTVRRAVWRANLISYAGLLAGCCAKVVYAVMRHPV